MTENGLLEYILDRLGRAETAKEFFGADEVGGWPDRALDTFIQIGLLRVAQPAQAVECKGCERYCFMPVQVRAGDGTRPARSFISCDKSENIGRVPVAMRRLEQWQLSGALLARTLARLLEFTQLPQEDNKKKRWMLGILKGKEHKGQVTLAVEHGVFLNVGGYDIPLAQVLTFNNGKLAADNDELLRLVDKPTAPRGASDYKPSVAKREVRKLDTRAIHESWQKAYRSLKREHPEKSDKWCSLQIVKQTDIALGRSAETIRKHMQK